MTTELSSTYLGIALRNPLIAGASPLTGDLDAIRRLEEAGAAAAVLPSLFEEQLVRDEAAVRQLLSAGPEQFAAVLRSLGNLDAYNTGPAHYLRHIKQAKAAVSIPIIASLSGVTSGGWTRHARLFEEAGADALELSLYFVATDPNETAASVEARYVDIVGAVAEATTIPVAVKIGPFFSSLPHMARRLLDVGADGLVLFNRFLQPDIDLAEMRMRPQLALSTSAELLLPLRWIAVLRPQFAGSLAGSTGVHTPEDVIKLILAGADAVMTASALLRHGAEYLSLMLSGLRTWMEVKRCGSLSSIKGSMSRRDCEDRRALERANYVEAITTYSEKQIGSA
jgi:dihydroorotate dehydrogenase (fumarate)